MLKLKHSTPNGQQDGTSLAQSSGVLPPAQTHDAVMPQASKRASTVILSALAGMKASSGPAPDTSGKAANVRTESHDAPKSFISMARNKLSVTEKLKQTLRAQKAARLAPKQKDALLGRTCSRVPHVGIDSGV